MSSGSAFGQYPYKSQQEAAGATDAETAARQRAALAQFLRPPQIKPHACGTCGREVFPANSLPGIGYVRENYCQCVKVQQPQEQR